MSKLFPEYIINLEKGTIYTLKERKGYVGLNKSNGGYSECNIYDVYGNHYKRNHEVIVAEGLQLPKHLWPVDGNGKRYIVDHITPVSNGGTDEFENLRLIPNGDNSKNEKSRENFSRVKKGKPVPWLHTEKSINKAKEKKYVKVYQYSIDGKLIKIWKSALEASKYGFSRSEISTCCNGGRKKKGKWVKVKTHKGYIWSKIPL